MYSRLMAGRKYYLVGYTFDSSSFFVCLFDQHMLALVAHVPCKQFKPNFSKVMHIVMLIQLDACSHYLSRSLATLVIMIP